MNYRQKVEFNFDFEAVPKQSARKGKNGFYQTDVITKYEEKVLIYALQQKPRGFKVMTGALICRVVYKFMPPVSMLASVKRQLSLGKKVYKITRPDLDSNLNKGLFDALNKKIFNDDSQVCKITAEKLYDIKSSIHLTLIEL